MHSTMKDRLNGVVLMHIYKHDVAIDADEIISEFVCHHCSKTIATTVLTGH